MVPSGIMNSLDMGGGSRFPSDLPQVPETYMTRKTELVVRNETNGPTFLSLERTGEESRRKEKEEEKTSRT